MGMTRRSLRIPLALALALLPAALPAVLSAQPVEIREEDRARLDAADAAFGRAMAEALARGAPGDIDRLTEALRGAALPPGEARLDGRWSCRTMKLGGLTPLTVYSPFTCEITRTGPDRWRFAKLTGSQRTEGTIVTRDGRLIYLGTSFNTGSAPVPYDSHPPTTVPAERPDQILPDVARVEAAGPDHIRLMFPRPWLESEFNILDLRR